MEYNDWYQRYQASQTQQPEKRRPKAGIGVGTLICCVLVAALLAGVAGGFITNAYLNRGAAQNESASLPAGAASSGGSGDKTGVAAGTLVQSPATVASGAYTKAQIVEITAPSVVGIDVTMEGAASYWNWGYGYGNDGGAQETTGAGSGVVITSDGYIATCNHVVEDAKSILVTLNDDTQYEATLVGADPRNDLAIIKINATGLTPASLGDSDMLTVGDDVIAIGNHLGELRGTATSGIISALNRELDVEGTEMALLQHDAAVSPGSSGGGLFNSSGSLIGIVNAKASSNNAEGLGFAIPVNSVKQIIDDLINFGYVKGRAYLGVYTQNVTLQSDRGMWGGYYGNSTSCVQVAQVMAGSAAEAAGMQANDLILAIGETEVTSNDVLSNAIGAYNAGDTATLTIQRDGGQMEISVTFGEYSPE